MLKLVATSLKNASRGLFRPSIQAVGLATHAFPFFQLAFFRCLCELTLTSVVSWRQRNGRMTARKTLVMRLVGGAVRTLGCLSKKCAPARNPPYPKGRFDHRQQQQQRPAGCHPPFPMIGPLLWPGRQKQNTVRRITYSSYLDYWSYYL